MTGFSSRVMLSGTFPCRAQCPRHFGVLPDEPLAGRTDKAAVRKQQLSLVTGPGRVRDVSRDKPQRLNLYTESLERSYTLSRRLGELDGLPQPNQRGPDGAAPNGWKGALVDRYVRKSEKEVAEGTAPGEDVRAQPPSLPHEEQPHPQAQRQQHKRRIGKEQPRRPWFWGMSERGMRVFQRVVGLRPKEVVRAVEEEEATRGVLKEGDVMGLMKGFGKQGRWQHALALFEWSQMQAGPPWDSFPQPQQVNPSSVSLILRILSRCDRISEAESLFRVLMDNGFRFDVYSFTSMMSALSQSGKHVQAVTLFERMKAQGVAPNLVTYNVVLGAYGKSGGSFHRMLQLLQELQGAGLGPDEYTYNTMISACADGAQVAEAERLLAEMQARPQCEPSRVTFNALLDVYGKAGELDKAKAVLKQMSCHGLTPNRVTYNELLSACAQLGQWEEAEALLAGMEDEWGLKPDVFSFSSLLRAYGRAGQSCRVPSVVRRMGKCGCVPNLVTFNIMVDVYGCSGMMGEVEGVLLSMRSAGCSPDVVTWNTVIRSYGHLRDLEGVERSFQALLRSGITPNRRTYTALLDAYGACGLPERVKSAYRDMQLAGHTPNAITYTSLLAPLANAGCWADVSRISQEMKERGVRLAGDELHAFQLEALSVAGETEKLLEALYRLRACARVGVARREGASRIGAVDLDRSVVLALCRVNMAVEAEAAAEAASLALDTQLLNALLTTYGRQGRAREVQRLFSDAAAKGVPRDLVSYNAMIAVLGRAGHTAQAKSLLDEMCTQGFPPNSASHAGIILALCKEGDAAGAIKVVERMDKDGLCPDGASLSALAALLFRRHHFSNSAALFRRLADAGLSLTAPAYNMWVDALCATRHFTEAAAVALLPTSSELSTRLRLRVSARQAAAHSDSGPVAATPKSELLQPLQ